MISIGGGNLYPTIHISGMEMMSVACDTYKEVEVFLEKTVYPYVTEGSAFGLVIVSIGVGTLYPTICINVV